MVEKYTGFTGSKAHGAKSGGQKQPKPPKAVLLVKRAEDRKAANERRKGQAEKSKEEGNTHFRQGRYVEAIAKYNEAVKINGLRPIIMANLAAAYLKLEQYELAEWACDCTLLHSPRFAKARFRRAMARKGQGMFKGAELDLIAVIEHHPEITEAQNELSKVQEERKKHGDGQRPEPTYNETLPPVDADEWDPPLDSDSEDVKHTGNERPCRFYNRGGCGKGSLCEYSHAPDDKSVRDDLGQNVCLHFLLGDCKFGTRCSYLHSEDYLPQGWWSTPKQVEGARRLRAALDDAETEDHHTIETLENTTAYGRTKKSQDYQEDFKIYSALRSDVLTSRIKDKTLKTPAETPQKDPSRFVLILCLRDPETFSSVNSHLLKMLKTKLKIVYAKNATQASTYLEAPELAGVIVGDAGITDLSNLGTVSQLVDYARNGGSVVFAGLFPSFISGTDFSRFFSQHFGLQWKYGSYFRTTFYKNAGSDIVKKNPSLEPSYSMKALHVQGITPESAVYKANQSSRTRSHVFPSAPVTDFDESPAVSTRVGKGIVSFLGDVNAEDESTKTTLAMLGILDSSLPPDPAPPKTEKTESEGKKKQKKSKNEAKGAHPTQPSAPKPGTPSTANDPQKTASSQTRRFIMHLSLHDSELSDRYTTAPIQAIRTRMGVRKAATESQALALLSSSDLAGVYVTDCALTDQKYKPLLKKLASYVEDGGCVVFGGTFGCFAKFPQFAPLFAEFGLDWKAVAYTNETLELNYEYSKIVDRNPFLPKKISINAVFLGGVKPYNMVYYLPHVFGDPQTPVAFGDVGEGHVGYIGDIDPDACTTPILLAMFDLLKYPRPLKKPDSLKFVIALVRLGFIDEYEQTPLFKQLKETRVEIITDDQLSDPRLVNLLSSPDLLGVLALDDISLPERRWFNHEIAAYAWSGGTLIFCGDSGTMTPPHDFERFMTDSFCLPWQISSVTELPVELNQGNELVRRLPQAIKQESMYYEGSFLYDVDQDAVVYSSERGPGPEPAYVPVAYTAVGNGHVGFFGHNEIGESDTKLVLAMLGLVPLASPTGEPAWRNATQSEG